MQGKQYIQTGVGHLVFNAPTSTPWQALEAEHLSFFLFFSSLGDSALLMQLALQSGEMQAEVVENHSVHLHKNISAIIVTVTVVTTITQNTYADTGVEP